MAHAPLECDCIDCTILAFFCARYAHTVYTTNQQKLFHITYFACHARIQSQLRSRSSSATVYAAQTDPFASIRDAVRDAESKYRRKQSSGSSRTSLAHKTRAASMPFASASLIPDDHSSQSVRLG